MKKVLFLFISALLLTACSDDDDNVSTHAIEGVWTMTKYLSFAPELPELTEGEIVWVFNADNTVTKTNQGETYVSPNGTFNYHIEGDTIIFETEEGFEEKYFYSFPDGGLKLEHELVASDGPVMVFKKYNQ